MNFIEEFYYGNINPQAWSSDQNPKVQKDIQTLSESENFLTDKLTGEEKRRFISYVDAGQPSTANQTSTVSSPVSAWVPSLRLILL